MREEPRKLLHFVQYKNFIPTSAYYNTVHALWCHDVYRYYSTLKCIVNYKVLNEKIVHGVYCLLVVVIFVLILVAILKS